MSNLLWHQSELCDYLIAERVRGALLSEMKCSFRLSVLCK